MGKEETMSLCSERTFSRGGGGEERISVSVRLRPLNQRELTRNDFSDWECIDNTTVVFKSNFPDRSLFPTAYTFDRVFDSDCTTEQVYEEAAKEIALSVVSGINSSIFAYGQTSSGKTYTMSGVTECAIADIFEYIEKHQEKEFVLKFSAMEIYNEHVSDLLSSESTPLRLLDDPEKGTIVDRLIEETLEDWNHLQELLSICEAQRQIGETSLNETSSRSHQILRLTVESSTRNYLPGGNSSTLAATVNFVDLAGSERASQTLVAGVRLKEGSHINRSLLTLGTVIRKLSKGRNGHIPYRDSKLTRILQNSLGGNARTAIICTMSPARSHIEQSRNTLLFASCAKEVTTNAQVNLVMSDKVLVKQLQRELARLESQLSSVGSISIDEDSIAALREKDLLIEEMNKEIKELTQQLDRAQSCIANMLKSGGDNQYLPVEKYSALESSTATTRSSRRKRSNDFGEHNGDSPSKQILQILGTPEDDFLLDDSTPKFTGLDPCEGWEDIAQRNDIVSEDAYKEVQCIKARASSLTSIDGFEKEDNLTKTRPIDEISITSIQKEDKGLSRASSVNSYKSLKQKLQELRETIDRLQHCPASEGNVSRSEGFTWARSKSRRSILVTIPSTLWSDNKDTNQIFKFEEEFPGKPEAFEQKICEPDDHSSMGNISRIGSQESLHSACTADSMSTKVIDVDVDDTSSVIDLVAGLSKFNKFQSEKDEGDALVPETFSKNAEQNGTTDIGTEKGDINWSLQFERYQRKIIELWVKCNVPLVHRSYFFLLFKGDPSDNVYMEVELRRLHFLGDTLSRGADTSKGIDGRTVTSSSSLKALNREREMLAKQLQKKFTRKEREDLYQRWGISLESKRRSLQLAYRLWTDTGNLKHVKESATLVAKLVGFVEPRYVPKEIFGLSLSSPSISRRSSRWRENMSSLL